ncbi:uncharacterized protein LOC113521383 isoform X2 [Galleria mellonella]|uniref:Uncharacterized protein LOC113521383 isoform X2 n=1 Tax=Galleria mellonella TaxID=7137 RepID=A0A6J3C7N2_GALME|nr:uncharacterized protein LOC113521383 isoform X2 [Galleria mellonella]
MSQSKNIHKLPDKSGTDIQTIDKNEGEMLSCNPTESTYAVTVSKKPSPSGEDEAAPCAGQKSFISIHSTDQLCQVADIENPSVLEVCNVEVLTLNEVFPSTSEESLSNEDDSPLPRRQKFKNKPHAQKMLIENVCKSTYVPTNSKSSTVSGTQKELDGQISVYSDFDIPKSTLYVVGSNPGEPKMSYQDPPKKISKTMKKFLRNIDKHKNEQNSKINEKVISKLTTMRGILKDGRCTPECTGDSTVQEPEEFIAQDLTLPFPMDFSAQLNYTKHSPDKNVTFNTQVVIIHFTGDLCVGQSVETLSKEKDQQARNSELRKTFLSKYNEFWHTQK